MPSVAGVGVFSGLAPRVSGSCLRVCCARIGHRGVLFRPPLMSSGGGNVMFVLPVIVLEEGC